MTAYLRPDEQVAQKKKESSDTMKSLLTAGTNLAGGAYLASKVAPFLSEHLPIDLAVKGISKVAPKLGKFLDEGKRMGLDVKEGIDFIKDKMQPAKEETSKESKLSNILGEFSPELQAFIEQEIQAGKAPDHAAASAMPRAEFSDIIRKIEGQSKKKFTALVRELYEGKAIDQDQNQTMQSPQATQMQGQQQGAGQQALMQTLQKINQRLGG